MSEDEERQSYEYIKWRFTTQNRLPSIQEFHAALPDTWDEAAKRGTITKDKFEEIAANCFTRMMEKAAKGMKL